MDIQLKKKPWYLRYKYYILTGVLLLGLLVYSITLSFGPKHMSLDEDMMNIATVEDADFLEYVDTEGIVHPIMTIRVNALESGFVDEIYADEGMMLNQGDTIISLKNPELMRTIADEQDEWMRQQRIYREQEIEMEQKSLALQQQALDARYEMSNLDNKLRIAQEEYQMGMKSKAEIDIAQSEYDYHSHKNALQMQSLQHDSAASVLKRELLQDDIRRAQTKRDRALSRSDGLYVTAPVTGQLSFLNATPGQQIASGASVCEIKMLNDYKIQASLNEYYIDRLISGLNASITQGNNRYPLKVSRVVPEIKDRNFQIDLIFTSEKPTNLRLGKSYRVQIELGQPETALIIPKGDFYSKTNGKWIYRLSPDGNRAIKTDISIGRQNPLQYEILSGLKPGDKVIVSGYNLLGDNNEIILK